MAEGQTMIFAMANVTSSDGVVSIGRHTSQISFMNQGADFVDIKLNGRHIIKIGHGQVEAHFYNSIDGDYTTFEVLTAGQTVSMYALG
jgi:Golgi nucleoside diphosphatase